VLDKAHNRVFVFGGLVFLSQDERDIAARKYSAAEKTIRRIGDYGPKAEIKACTITAEHRGKLYRSLNGFYKFGAVIDQAKVLDSIMRDKKAKQRFLDYAFKIGLKRLLERLITQGIINPSEVQRIVVYVDEHSTSTNGLYELKESLEEEFKRGTHSHNYTRFFPPIFPNLLDVQLNYCNSATVRLVRAADIVANRIYGVAMRKEPFAPFDTKEQKLLTTNLP
jgi:hypothetical protein